MSTEIGKIEKLIVKGASILTKICLIPLVINILCFDCEKWDQAWRASLGPRWVE